MRKMCPSNTRKGMFIQRVCYIFTCRNISAVRARFNQLGKSFCESHYSFSVSSCRAELWSAASAPESLSDRWKEAWSPTGKPHCRMARTVPAARLRDTIRVLFLTRFHSSPHRQHIGLLMTSQVHKAICSPEPRDYQVTSAVGRLLR